MATSKIALVIAVSLACTSLPVFAQSGGGGGGSSGADLVAAEDHRPAEVRLAEFPRVERLQAPQAARL
jgi:hypothetical protein